MTLEIKKGVCVATMEILRSVYNTVYAIVYKMWIDEMLGDTLHVNVFVIECYWCVFLGAVGVCVCL